MMRQAIQLAAIAVAVVGMALWFFGGMHLTSPAADAAHDSLALTEASGLPEASDRTDFRPGLGFLAGTWGLAAVLWMAGLKFPAGRPAR